MEPVTLVATALVAGAAAGISGTAAKAVADAYESLKSLVVACLRRGGVAEDTGQELVDRVADGDRAKEALKQKLAKSGVDEPTAEAAQKLLDLLEGQRPKFEVHAPDAKGLQVGDHNTQHNTFS